MRCKMEKFFWILFIVMIVRDLAGFGEFSLYYLWKYKKTYTDWFFNRQTFQEYLEHTNEV